MSRFDDLKAGSGYLNRPRRELCQNCGAVVEYVHELDGDKLCQQCADHWARGQAPEPEFEP
jgi:hypothetical protein